MKAPRLLQAALLAVATMSASATPTLAAGGGGEVVDHEWSFEGPFGAFDRAQLQRGWQIYSEVCSACHGMRYLHYRDLGRVGGPEFPPEQVEAIAEGFLVKDFDTEGQEIERPAKPTDPILSPYPNEEAATAILGAAPPDLSLITKNRTGYHGIVTQMVKGLGGTEYIYSLMIGYRDPPEQYDLPDGSYFNAYYPGHAIKMAPQLIEDRVTYQDGTPATTEQMAADVAAFLAWAAEPSMEERKQAGFANLIFLAIFAMLLWFSTKKLWKPIKEGKDA